MEASDFTNIYKSGYDVALLDVEREITLRVKSVMNDFQNGKSGLVDVVKGLELALDIINLKKMQAKN